MQRDIRQRSQWNRSRIRRCQTQGRRGTRADILERYTRPLPLDELTTQRSDYTIACPISRDWLLAHSRRLVRIQPPRWTS